MSLTTLTKMYILQYVAKIKPQLFLFGLGHIVITDFGLAKWLSSGQKTSTVTGTLKYMGKSL